MEEESKIYYTHADKRTLYTVGVDPKKVYEDVGDTELQQAEMTDNQCRDLIPSGLYCYSKDTDGENQICPFWDEMDKFPSQNNGYCHYLAKGDWQLDDSVGLLWDQCKECGVKEWNQGDWQKKLK